LWGRSIRRWPLLHRISKGEDREGRAGERGDTKGMGVDREVAMKKRSGTHLVSDQLEEDIE